MKYCEHNCGAIAGRSKYCENRPDRTAVADAALELIDDVLYSESGAADHFSISSGSKEQVTQRQWSRIEIHDDVWPWAIGEQELAIQHRIDKKLGAETYTITSRWYSLHRELEEESRTTYVVEKYVGGTLRATVDGPDVMLDKNVERAMAEYDFDQILNELADMSAVSYADQDDNARVAQLEADY